MVIVYDIFYLLG